MARNDPLPPLPTTPAKGIYRHYKGHLYEVLGLVRHSEELTPYVLYRCLDERAQAIDEVLWVRPRAMWDELVEHEGRSLPRFSPVAS